MTIIAAVHLVKVVVELHGRIPVKADCDTELFVILSLVLLNYKHDFFHLSITEAAVTSRLQKNLLSLFKLKLDKK